MFLLTYLWKVQLNSGHFALAPTKIWEDAPSACSNTDLTAADAVATPMVVSSFGLSLCQTSVVYCDRPRPLLSVAI